jgi:mannose-6-phosphate isomerase-like protein (cupin superfamily)
MFVKRLADCEEFTANDGCRIRELLHYKHDPVEIPYSIAVGTVEPGSSTLKHKLEQGESYFILEGEGTMHVSDEACPIAAEELVYVPSEAVQWIENTGKETLRFMVIVHPPWTEKGDQLI